MGNWLTTTTVLPPRWGWCRRRTMRGFFFPTGALGATGAGLDLAGSSGVPRCSAAAKGICNGGLGAGRKELSLPH